jgi:predicted nucleotidyltransferase
MDLPGEIRRVFAPFKPLRILLFGSRARGDADNASDVDLIVVYRTPKRFLDRLDELYEAFDLPFACDILAYTPEEFERLRRDSPFLSEVLRTARVIHEAA